MLNAQDLIAGDQADRTSGALCCTRLNKVLSLILNELSYCSNSACLQEVVVLMYNPQARHQWQLSLTVPTAAKVKSVLAAKDLRICADLSFLSLACIWTGQSEANTCHCKHL